MEGTTPDSCLDVIGDIRKNISEVFPPSIVRGIHWSDRISVRRYTADEL